jgi:hypothetical protein
LGDLPLIGTINLGCPLVNSIVCNKGSYSTFFLFKTVFMRVKIIFSYFVFLCFFVNISVAQNKILRGFVKNQATKEIVPFATVYEVNNKKGVVVDENGYFQLNLKKHDSLVIEVSHINYEKLTYNYFLKRDTVIILFINEKQLNLDQVFVYAKQKNVYENTSFSRIDSKQLNTIPSLGGEKDIIKALQLTPGVQGGIEGTNEIIVRGGEPGQNLYLLDNMPIYSPSHLYGFFSTFNSDIVQSADIVRSGLAANFGGKISSLIDVKSKASSLNNLNGAISIGLISSKLYTEIPVMKEESSIMFSFRRSYFDLLTKMRAKYDMENEHNKIGFYDAYVKYEHHINRKNIFTVNYLGSRDKFYYIFNNPNGVSKSEDVSGVNWGNDALFLNYKHFNTRGDHISFIAGFSNYEYNNINESYYSGVIEDSYEKKSAIKDIIIKSDSKLNITGKFNILFGGCLIYHNLSPTVLTIRKNVIKEENEYSNEIALFIQANYDVNQNNNLSIGLRQNGYFSGTSNFYPLEPRVNLVTLISKNWKIKSSVSRNVQFIHRIEDYSAGLPTETWYTSNKNLVFEDGFQVSTEIIHSLNKQNIEIGMAPYMRWMNGLVANSNFYSDFPLPNSLSSNIHEADGNGKSYGLELYCNKNIGHLIYSASYMYSYSLRKFQNINNNSWYPSSNDRRHYLMLNAGYNYKEKYLFSVNWNYSSGRPVTLPNGQYIPPHEEENDLNAYYIGDRNNFWLRDYHRLDISIQHKRIKRNGHRIWELSVYNAYNRANPFNIDIETSVSYENGTFINQGKKFKQYSLFPIIPSLTYIRKFN